MNRCRRTIFLVDRKVQGSLAMRTILYWLFCLFSVSLMLLCWESLVGPRRSFFVVAGELLHRYGPALLASLVLLPIALMDVIRLSNRFVGPARRLGDSLRALAEGGEIQPVHFRDDDFWQEMARDLNRVSGRLAAVEKDLTPTVDMVEEDGLVADPS
jgi:hypothetical protein